MGKEVERTDQIEIRHFFQRWVKPGNYKCYGKEVSFLRRAVHKKHSLLLVALLFKLNLL